MKYVAYIDSPLQAFNLMEYCLRFDRKIDYLCCNITSGVSSKNKEQMVSSLESVPSHNLLPLDVGGAIKDFAAIRAAISRLKAQLPDEEICLISGEYRSLVFRSLLTAIAARTREVVIIDDGTATLRIERRRPPAPRERLRSLACTVLGISNRPPAAALFFTAYDIQGKILPGKDSLVRNDYRAVRDDIANKPPKTGRFIIGSPLLEAGVVETEEADIRILDSLLELGDNSGWLYVPHRRERSSKLDYLGQRGIEIVEPGLPFELFCIKQGYTQLELRGLYSSLFINMAEIYGTSIGIRCRKPEMSLVAKNWQSFVENIYSEYDRFPSISVVEGGA